jgi:hypothetical protein
MLQYKFRFLPMLALGMFLLGAWGWLLPAHLCRMPSDCLCGQVDSCCEEPAAIAVDDQCCFEIDNYFNFPVYFLERLPSPTLVFVLLADILTRNDDWISNSTAELLFSERPPPDSPLSGRLFLGFCSFRV